MGYFLDELFSSIPLFATLSRSDMSYLSSRIDYIFDYFGEDDILIKEGSASTSFFILIKGTAKVTFNNSPDEIVTILNPGDIFGEMSYLTGKPRSANVTACSDVMVMQLSSNSLQELPPKIRDIIKDKLIELMTTRLKSMTSDDSEAESNKPAGLINGVLGWLGI
ncbi:conserved hypothetical protein [Desulfamplus magnetovallimortis]|uniref:Cyclic nucleotide-binding domain-containing protein n=1 Tax=Desulfamplus magnetovallimortis TaxID=1246637 RepID=A0A1W1HCG7_9BACT|nr:cyclic nucleotide-binding domain-containing protein [Desulfamplus magnetovallimortis]SLM30149.1 conserved hypothetical protein [Desulfamplus magnetovallimortis]